jgi:UDP-glucose 4-epimerase
MKEANLAPLRDHSAFRLVEERLQDTALARHLEGASAVFHLAAQAGVRASWGREFAHYTEHNVLATQRLLEAALEAGRPRVVYASSSSVYGDLTTSPEGSVPPAARPPLRRRSWPPSTVLPVHGEPRVPTLSLRYFTVYGPRQRPDMAFHIFIRAMLEGRALEVYGDGEQTRDFTYVSDIVDANVRAATRGTLGETYNVGGGTRTSLTAVIGLLEAIGGATLRREMKDMQKGDVRHTLADVTRAERDLGYVRHVALEEGLTREYRWLKERLGKQA